MRLRLYILLVTSLFSFWGINAQNKSNRGKEFWLGYSFSSNFFPHAGLSDPVNQQELTLYISTTNQPANVTVSINGTTWTQTLSIPANTADATILIPKSGVNDARILSDGLSAKAIHVVSNVPVAVYAHEYDAMYSAATMLMPSDTWGYIYYSVNYYQTQGFSNPPFTQSNQGVNFPDWYNWFYIVAKDDNTRVLITPSDTCKNGWLPGQTYTVNLNKGEIYTVFGKANFAAGWFTDTVNSSKDLTGSKILSVAGADGNCHPVALFSGTGGMHVCQKDGGEAVQQQVFPAQAWGTRYLTHHTISNFTGDINATFRNYYRVCVKDPTTVVRRNGVVLTGLIRNFYYQYLDSTGGDYIEADKPILVSQYVPNRAQCWQNITPAQTAIGDPEMFYLSPVEQGQNSVIFYTSSHNLISKSYVNIIIPTAGVSSLLVDGAAVPISKIKLHPNNPVYSVAIADLSGTMDMQHTITSDSTFTATVYGLGAYESYGYNVGCNINNLDIKSEIKNVFGLTSGPDTVTCPKTPFRIFAKVGYPLTNIHWKFSQVPGLIPTADSIIANPIPVNTPVINGRQYYTYTVQQDLSFANAGTYKIPFSYTAPNIDACNNTQTDTIVVVVRPGPVANFSLTNQQCLKDTVYFTGTSNPNGFTLYSYLWNFDDATTQTTVNAKKRFITSGNQNIRYRIYADNGCAGDTTKTINIFPESVSKLGASSPSCDSVLITDTSSITSGTIKTWQYSFGDGNTLVRTSNASFYHVYSTAGTYTIKLVTISDNNCISDTSYRTVTVLGRPLAKFGYDRNICVGDSIRITDTSSASAGTILSWQYNFGDGNTLTRNTNTPFYHTYLNGGNFTVYLVVSGSNGCVSDTFKLTVNVSSKPAATFTVSGKPCLNSVNTFTSSVLPSSGNPPTWNWVYGDGQTGNSAITNIATHSYTSLLTNVIIKHWVSYSGGCSSDTAFATIPIINTSPVASFTVTGGTLCEKKPVVLTSSTTGITSWNWDFGNGTGAAAPPINRIYNTAGNYTISLVVTDAAGCSSLSATQMLTINPSPVVNAGPDKYIQSGSSATLDATINNPGNYNFVWTPPLYLDNAAILNPVSTPDSLMTYTIQAIDKVTNCTGQDNVIISPVFELYIPSAFTPNNDGKNDKWIIPGLALYPDARVMVFNRWGEKIFETKGYQNNPWSGMYKGLMQPHDVYVYIIQLTDDKKKIIKGTVTIIR